jgi:MYXO-CTERM domain-containing protein
MTTRTSAFLSLVLLTLGLGLPLPHAAAQGTAGTGGGTSAGGIIWVLNKIGADNYTDPTNRIPINKAQCDAKADLSLTLTRIPQGFKYLETWLGTTCNDANRANRGGTGMMNCIYVDSKEQDPVTTQDLNFQVSVEQMCRQGDGARSYFVLPVNTVMGTDAVMTFATVTLNVDQTPPSAPTSVKGGSGETEIPVTWTQPTEAYYYWVIVDTNVGANVSDAGVDASADDSGAAGSGGASGDVGGAAGESGGTGGSGGAAGSSGSGGAAGSSGSGGASNHGPAECASRYLTAGTHFNPQQDKLPPGVKSWFIDKKVSSTTLSGAEIGVPVGAVAVIADDLGKNESVLSNIDCVHVVKTNGFWDGYKAGGGDAQPGCACSTPGAGHRTTADSAWAWLAGLLGLAGYFRTRRRT